MSCMRIPLYRRIPGRHPADREPGTEKFSGSKGPADGCRHYQKKRRSREDPFSFWKRRGGHSHRYPDDRKRSRFSPGYPCRSAGCRPFSVQRRLPGGRKDIPAASTGSGQSRERRTAGRSSDPDLPSGSLLYTGGCGSGL